MESTGSSAKLAAWISSSCWIVQRVCSLPICAQHVWTAPNWQSLIWSNDSKVTASDWSHLLAMPSCKRPRRWTTLLFERTLMRLATVVSHAAVAILAEPYAKLPKPSLRTTVSRSSCYSPTVKISNKMQLPPLAKSPTTGLKSIPSASAPQRAITLKLAMLRATTNLSATLAVNQCVVSSMKPLYKKSPNLRAGATVV